MNLRTIVPFLSVFTACATAPVAKEPWPASASLSPEPFDPSAFAAGFSTARECERGARRVRSSSANDGWRALKACVAEGNFPFLELLATPTWARDLRTRSDAPALLSRVIAMQGGSIDHDLQLLHEQRVPLFSLEDSISAPELYVGRNLVFRGKVDEVRTDRGNLTAKVEEVIVQSAAFDSPIGYSLRHRSDLYAGNGALSRSVENSWHRTIRRYDNISKETGRQALLRLQAPDPFLEPGREFIILARFEGVRATSSGEDDDEAELIPVLTLISYHQPNALAVF